jgi:hypothetical protein
MVALDEAGGAFATWSGRAASARYDNVTVARLDPMTGRASAVKLTEAIHSRRLYLPVVAAAGGRAIVFWDSTQNYHTFPTKFSVYDAALGWSPEQAVTEFARPTPGTTPPIAHLSPNGVVTLVRRGLQPDTGGQWGTETLTQSLDEGRGQAVAQWHPDMFFRDFATNDRSHQVMVDAESVDLGRQVPRARVATMDCTGQARPKY